MKKIIWGLVVAVLLISAFLIYDYIVKMQALNSPEQTPVTFYSWTDDKGIRHYTDIPPPDQQNSEKIKKIQGFKHKPQPLILIVRDKVIQGYRYVREKTGDWFTKGPEEK